MTAGAVHVAMNDLFSSSVAERSNLDLIVESAASKRVVEVDIGVEFPNLGDNHIAHAFIRFDRRDRSRL